MRTWKSRVRNLQPPPTPSGRWVWGVEGKRRRTPAEVVVTLGTEIICDGLMAGCIWVLTEDWTYVAVYLLAVWRVNIWIRGMKD